RAAKAAVRYRKRLLLHHPDFVIPAPVVIPAMGAKNLSGGPSSAAPGNVLRCREHLLADNSPARLLQPPLKWCSGVIAHNRTSSCIFVHSHAYPCAYVSLPSRF